MIKIRKRKNNKSEETFYRHQIPEDLTTQFTENKDQNIRYNMSIIVERKKINGK